MKRSDLGALLIVMSASGLCGFGAIALASWAIAHFGPASALLGLVAFFVAVGVVGILCRRSGSGR